MTVPFPEPTDPRESRADVFLGYLDFYRSVLVAKLDGLSDGDLRRRRLRSGWAPLELLKHLIHVEHRWLVWGFEGERVPEPWADHQDGRWHVGAGETLPGLVAALEAQASRTRTIVEAHDLEDTGQPGERWRGAAPATLERILLHLMQEYARHVGHLDVVRELIDGRIGEQG